MMTVLVVQAAAEYGAIIANVLRDVARLTAKVGQALLSFLATPQGIILTGIVVLFLAFSLARKR